MPVIDRQVVASTDDTFRRLHTSYWALTFAHCYAGGQSTVNWQNGSGMRFLNITIPPDSVIDSAKLTLRCSAAAAGVVVNTRISAENIDDAPTFADDAAAFDTRWANRTANRVDWDAIAEWVLNSDYDSPDIKDVIQEIVDRPGWVSGNDIVIFWEDYEDRSSHLNAVYRSAYSFNGSALHAPNLHIEYHQRSYWDFATYA